MLLLVHQYNDHLGIDYLSARLQEEDDWYLRLIICSTAVVNSPAELSISSSSKYGQISLGYIPYSIAVLEGVGPTTLLNAKLLIPFA